MPSGPAAHREAVTAPETKDERRARLESEKLAQAERLVRAEIRRGAFPGAALAAGRGAHVELLRGVGNAEWGKYEVDRGAHRVRHRLADQGRRRPPRP